MNSGRTTDTTAGRLFWVTYSSVRRADEPKPKLFQARDGASFLELRHAPPLLGYAYETMIHLYPGLERKLEDYPRVGRGDLLVLTTRPPLDDPPPKKRGGVAPAADEMQPTVRKVIEGSGCGLERIIFNEVRRYFAACTRKGLKLTDAAAGLLKDPRKWQQVKVHGYLGAVHMHILPTGLEIKARKKNATLGFLIRTNRIPELGCDLIVSFGIDGYGTLVWNRLVRKRYPDWLEKPGFVMAQLAYLKPTPLNQPATPEFAEDESQVEVEILTNGAA